MKNIYIPSQEDLSFLIIRSNANASGICEGCFCDCLSGACDCECSCESCSD